MVNIEVIRTLDAPIGDVFAMLTDHANYKQFRGIIDSELTREGRSEMNGLGAQRRIQAKGVTFFEDVVGFERPTLFEYRIVKMTPPILKHLLGRVELTDNNGKTDVRWVSESKVRIPLLGGFLGKRMAAGGHKAFDSILRTIEKKCAEKGVDAQAA